MVLNCKAFDITDNMVIGVAENHTTYVLTTVQTAKIGDEKKAYVWNDTCVQVIHEGMIRYIYSFSGTFV